MKTLETNSSRKTLIQIRRAALKAKVALSKLLGDCSKFNQHSHGDLHLNPVDAKIRGAIDPLMDLMNQCSDRERMIDRQEREAA